jgi:hypothetical protein
MKRLALPIDHGPVFVPPSGEIDAATTEEAWCMDCAWSSKAEPGSGKPLALAHQKANLTHFVGWSCTRR